jgi:hypothetical protein
MWNTYSTSSLWRRTWQRVPKRRQNTIWRRGNTQNNIYNIQNTAKVWNQEYICIYVYMLTESTIFTTVFIKLKLTIDDSCFDLTGSSSGHH